MVVGEAAEGLWWPCGHDRLRFQLELGGPYVSINGATDENKKALFTTWVLLKNFLVNTFIQWQN